MLSFFMPGVFQYIVHLERLEGLHISSFHYVQMTDELTVEATYKGHQFCVNMAWEGDLYLTASVEVPKKIFTQVCRHMHAYRRVWPLQVLRASKRYAHIAKSAG